MDVAESQETLAGPSQQAPMDVTESQETLPGPSQQASMDVATMLDIQPGPSQAFRLTPLSFDKLYVGSKCYFYDPASDSVKEHTMPRPTRHNAAPPDSIHDNGN
ncbi:uncharacterized protein LOC144097809 [Amblyomma americanum]